MTLTMSNTKCACSIEGGCHCLEYEPAEHCDCALCQPTIDRARRDALALSAQRGEDEHNKERARWGLGAIVTGRP